MSMRETSDAKSLAPMDRPVPAAGETSLATPSLNVIVPPAPAAPDTAPAATLPPPPLSVFHVGMCGILSVYDDDDTPPPTDLIETIGLDDEDDAPPIAVRVPPSVLAAPAEPPMPTKLESDGDPGPQEGIVLVETTYL